MNECAHMKRCTAAIRKFFGEDDNLENLKPTFLYCFVYLYALYTV